MNNKLIQRRRFLRSYRQLHPNQLEEVRSAIEAIDSDLRLGEAKKGRLSGFLVYKFRCMDQEFLIAYTVNEERREVTLEGLGPHENFYRDLKR